VLSIQFDVKSDRWVARLISPENEDKIVYTSDTEITNYTSYQCFIKRVIEFDKSGIFDADKIKLFGNIHRLSGREKIW
jgi:hypothetical protein